MHLIRIIFTTMLFSYCYSAIAIDEQSSAQDSASAMDAEYSCSSSEENKRSLLDLNGNPLEDDLVHPTEERSLLDLDGNPSGDSIFLPTEESSFLDGISSGGAIGTFTQERSLLGIDGISSGDAIGTSTQEDGGVFINKRDYKCMIK